MSGLRISHTASSARARVSTNAGAFSLGMATGMANMSPMAMGRML